MPLFNFLGGYNTTKRRQIKTRGKNGTMRHSLRQALKASLGAGASIKQSVVLPAGQDKNEWIAMNTIEMHNTVTLIYSLVAEKCTPEACTSMSASQSVSYLWQDEKMKKPIKVPACEYINHLFNWIDAKIEDDTIFPLDDKFPKNFVSEVKHLMKRMFRVYAHIYYGHLKHIQEINAESHLNTCFKHWYFFVQEFELVQLESMEPMLQVIELIKESERTEKSSDFLDPLHLPHSS